MKEELDQEKLKIIHAQVVFGTWFQKCEEMVNLANRILRVFPPILRDMYEEMTCDDTPTVVFDFVIFCN